MRRKRGVSRVTKIRCFTLSQSECSAARWCPRQCRPHLCGRLGCPWRPWVRFDTSPL